MISLESYVDTTNGWMSSLLNSLENPIYPRAIIGDWPLASGSACFTIILLYLIGTMVRRGGGIVLVVVGLLCSFPPNDVIQEASENVWGCVCVFSQSLKCKGAGCNIRCLLHHCIMKLSLLAPLSGGK